MIRNIVFDIGGVLADFRIKEFLMEKGFDGPMIKRILKASVMSPYWGRFERGEITEEEALQGFASSDPEIAEHLRKAFSSIEKAYDECAGSLEFMPYMDGGLVSFLAGKTKPDPEMYRMFLERYLLQADESVFVDDTEENVKAAKAIGFTGIEFHGPEELMLALKGLGIHIPESEDSSV